MSWLREDDEQTLLARVERTRVVAEAHEPETWRMFPGGPVSVVAFEEARRAYVHGLFLACVLLCQVCIEHSLAAVFRLSDDDQTARMNYSELLRAARRQRFLSDAEFELFDRLRDVRNPYVHSRSLDDATHPMRRAVATDTPPDDLLAGDAMEAISGLMALLSRPPFFHSG